jgi:predicted RNA binding protein YcfA (HicA-like mRNA interferase family)
MNSRRLAKLRREVASLRRRLGSIRARELEAVAKALGRELDTQKGKELSWVSRELPHRNPVDIPRHGSRNLKKGTAASILYEFELDLDDLEELYGDD